MFKNSKEGVGNIDDWGQKLAAWATTQHVTVSVNGLALNAKYPSSGGWEKAVYNHWENWQKVLGESLCSMEEVGEYFSRLDLNTSQEQLTKDLVCLGRWEFAPLSFSAD